MSDLSRLRARWVRLEKRIATLEAQLSEINEGDAHWIDQHEVMELTEKCVDAKEKLELTKTQVAVEEKRLLGPDAKLRFTGI